MVKTATIQNKLSELLARFPHIKEAYLYRPTNNQQTILLGILHESLSSDKRHAFFEEVAKLARQYLGSTDAIEVYDDLIYKRSSSWDLFSSVTPFYFLEQQSEIGKTSWAKEGRLLVRKFMPSK